MVPISFHSIEMLSTKQKMVDGYGLEGSSAIQPKMVDAYLGTSSMRATQTTMALVSSVLGFEIVELWTAESDGPLHCTFVHAGDSIIRKYPDLIVGHYPNHKKEHKLSPMLCRMAKESPDKYHWRVVATEKEKKGLARERKNSQGQLVIEYELSALHPELKIPAQTEMAYLLQGETGGQSVYIVAFGIDRIDFKPQKLKFLSGLGYAIYVAAFDLDADSDDEEDSAAALDAKIYMPRPLSQIFAGGGDSDAALGMGVWGSQHMAELHLGGSGSATNAPTNLKLGASSGSSNDFAHALTDSPISGQLHVSFKDQVRDGSPVSPASSSSSHHSANKSPIVEESLRNLPSQNLTVSDLLIDNKSTESVDKERPPGTPVPMALSLPPTWEPVDEFSYPVAEIPISVLVPDNLQMDHFDDMQHIADGSNANVFLAKLNGERVIVKMIKSDVQTDPVAVHEFDVEHGMLSRISHPNVIKLMGAGRVPRRFIVLEYLGGGSLNTILSQNQSKPGFAQKLFRRPTFTYANLLSKARDMAEALDFLHRRSHNGASIIHRDLKPDNVGFTSSGILKLFDFGLCTCVRRRRGLNEAYELTGNTGSLRYMAPEVALREPYTEKVDTYSFGIMVWQMARDRVPFKGLTREDFLSTVVRGGERPKLDKGWPSGFSNMLTACWHRDPQVRPSFETLVATLDKLIHEHTNNTLWPRRGKAFAGGAEAAAGTSPLTPPPPPPSGKSQKERDSHSTWF